MNVDFTKRFWRQYFKLPQAIQRQFDDHLKLWITDSTHPQLRVHPLKGRYSGYWSLNVSGDVRALYMVRGDQITIFMLIGTHSQLYG